MENILPQQEDYMSAAAAPPASIEQERVADRFGSRLEKRRRETSNLNVALVHDYLNQYGGAERVLEALHALFPQAPVYTSVYAPTRLPAAYRGWDIRTSFMQRLPLVTRRLQAYFALYAPAFEKFDLRT